jgi:hypothetical protein
MAILPTFDIFQRIAMLNIDLSLSFSRDPEDESLFQFTRVPTTILSLDQEDILELKPFVKHLNLFSRAEGKMLFSKALRLCDHTKVHDICPSHLWSQIVLKRERLI